MPNDFELDEDLNSTVAHMSGVRGSLDEAADDIGSKARAILATHHGRTPLRFHDDSPPEIVVTRGKLDRYVFLEAGSVPRAVGIEYGHRFQSRRKNRSGPWGQSSGIHVLGRAAARTSLGA